LGSTEQPFLEASMQRTPNSSGWSFEAKIGYSRAAAQGAWVFVSGTAGFDYASMKIAEDIETQTDPSMRNISAALAHADANLGDVVKVN
jgi:enamine deaminase RidA (YjgF/YER057c/UK114 family)